MADIKRPTTVDLINNLKFTKVVPIGHTVEVEGYTSKGDGGKAEWIHEGVTAQTPSQSPAQLGDALLNDGNGNQWALVVDGELNVLSLGAKGDNSTDNLAPFNAAINTHKAIFIPEGVYNLSATWLFDDNDVTVRFSGQGNCKIVPTFATGDIIQIGQAGLTKNVHLRGGFTIDAPGGVPRTADAGIGMFDAQQCSIESCELLDMFYGLHITGGNTTHVVFNDMVIRNLVPANGIGVLIDGGGDHFFNNLSINNPELSQPAAGMKLKNSNATWIDNSDVLHSGVGLLIAPDVTDICTWLFATNSAFDLNSSDGIRIESVGVGAINKGHQFTSCWTSSNTLTGVKISGDDIPDGIYFNGHRSFNNGSNGYLLDKGVNVSFDASQAGGNSQTVAGTSAGFQINANVQKFAVRGCNSGLQARFVNLQGRGITINAGTSDDYIVTGNDFTGNTASPLDGGTGVNKIFSGNIS